MALGVFQMQNRNVTRSALVGASLLAAAGASQAAIDTSGITTAIGEAATAGAAVGTAVLVMIVAIKVFKWIRGAM